LRISLQYGIIFLLFKKEHTMRTLLSFLLLLFLAGCASIPKESVELSVTLGRDLAEVHRAHRQLAKNYFDRIHTDIDQFIDEEYRPFIIRRSLEGFQLLEKLEAASQLGAELPAPGPADTETADTRPDALQILELYVTKVSGQIESYRSELHRNIEIQQQVLLESIDSAYQQLQNANAIVTGHLASVRKVADAQAELLERTGLDTLSSMLIEKTVQLSQSIAVLVEQARKGEVALDEIARELESSTRGGQPPPD
jgi:hypothetical protein